jgi:hypothetical protein
MKPGKPLERRTPLKSCGRLERKGALARGSGLARRAAVKASKRAALAAGTAADGIGERVARDRTKARSGGWCEIQMDGCFGRATDWHHRLRDGQGGLWQASNGLHLCRWCHEAVTNTRGHRAEYEANGWLVPTGTVPADVPVLLPTGQRVLLDDVGDYLPVAA